MLLLKHRQVTRQCLRKQIIMTEKPAQFSFKKLLELPRDGISRAAYSAHVKLEENIAQVAQEIHHNLFIDHAQNMWIVAVIDENDHAMHAKIISNHPEIKYSESVIAGLNTLDDKTRETFRHHMAVLVAKATRNPHHFIRQYCQQ